MIFVTLGTQKFQMNRLLKAVDKLAEAGNVKGDIFIQRGTSTYKPKHCEYVDFMDEKEYVDKIQNCSLLITHAGVGTIITGIKADKPVIVVPRLSKFDEHVDDHQTEIAKAFSGKGSVLCCEDTNELINYIEKARTFDFQPYEVNGGNVEDKILHFMNMFDEG
ncbi:PssE/Cps14G family polysaccharide biosynthesis glycosyltransferase [Butyrivibrio sp. VCD2006]|uniref:PssE/Cps14G family polysaccharide biosynthesis glycosyltransferase n=1 Tax=Butyrivibrio sp. VCD2006 TaxID=1280664 RepID=UPI00047C75E7|nr:PssE/Cps14G family polysaccharide biosynthesis glycosyltransferase [Butyrivibrio sp. VCD2006]